LFGNTASNTQQNTGSGLFGATQNQPNQQQPQQTGGTGLFGATTNQPNQQQQQTGTSSLFGGSTANKPSGGLFGASTTNNASSGGLFGGNTGSSLFGGANTQQNQQQPSTGLFGASTQQQQPSTGLFGASTQQRPTSNLFGASTQQQPTNSLFGAANQQNQQQQAPTSTFLGMTATAPGANQNVSLLGNSQFRDPQIGSFAGRLTLGQPSNQATAGTTQGATGTGAVQVNYDTMKSTTRFNDLIPEVQQALERIDNMIRFQEDFCRQIEAFIPNHGPAVDSLKPDVEFIAEKAEAAETALALDAQGVQSEKSVLRKDIEDGERLQKVVENLKHPIQYHVRGDDAASKDLDLISHFFQPLTNDMSNTLSVYANAIAEVEGHMSILEASVLNAGARIGRAGGGNEGVGSVRELAETLGAFEEGILGAAGLVGECREGVNSLVLGR
jgi:nucleoporin p58/p45